MHRAVAYVLALVALASAALAQPLPTDPRLVTGELDNGLRYIIRRHDNPPSRAAVWLHISTGSLNETEPQRGLAHFLEHLAFNGSEHFEPGSVLPFFQSLGLSFGLHQNAFTSFDQTVYQLALPDNTPETLDKALLFLSDVSRSLLLAPEEIEKEREIILEEKRTALGARQRVGEYILARWAPGSLVGERLPIGVEQTIRGVQRQDFLDYYKRWYVPSNMTVFVVADMDEKIVAEAVTKHFQGGERVPAPVDQDARVTTAAEHRAIVASDPELARAEVSIMRVTPAREPTTTVEGFRRDLTRILGGWAFNRRMARLVADGNASFQRGSASASDSFRAVHITDATVTGDKAEWRAMLTQLAVELRRAVLHGFTAREVDDARKQMLAALQRAVETDPTIPADALLRAMNNALAQGEPITSAAQDLELAEQVFGQITPEEVSALFKSEFDPTPAGVVFVLQVPSSADVPTEDALLALGLEVIAATPDAGADAARAESLMTTLPAPGTVVESDTHEKGDVWSAWLSNNARVHYHHTDYRKDEATITITLAAGDMQETPETRGVSDAAASAWQRPATSTLSSNQVRDLMVGRKVSVGGRGGLDTMAVSVDGSPAELEEGLKLAHLLLTDPVVEGPAFDQWKQLQQQILAIRPMQIEFVFFDLFTDATYPKNESRVRPITAEQLEALTREKAQERLREIIASAPMEVTVVGDIDRARAEELVLRYIGSLPSRPRITPDPLAPLRKLDRPVGPIVARQATTTPTDKAMVISGFFGAEIDAVQDQRLLTLAAKVLTTRMVERLRESKGLVYAISANSSGAQEFPGYGTFYALSSTAPDKVDALLAELSAMYAEFAKDGPTDDELAVAQKQLANLLDERMREPAFWTATLAALTYRGRQLEETLDTPAALQAATTTEVRDAFARYFIPTATFTVAVTPAGPANTVSP